MIYNNIVNAVSSAISNSLFEMAKNISHRSIDRKLWLTVASICSRNKATEAENIKPVAPDKNDKDRMIQRYVAALLIMKKPCPKNEQDIDKIKTFKLIGKRALELGASINDIINCYNDNNDNKKTVSSISTISEPQTSNASTKTPINTDNDIIVKHKVNNKLDMFTKGTYEALLANINRLLCTFESVDDINDWFKPIIDDMKKTNGQ